MYKHQDLERVHYHIVSTRIDKATGKKIRDGYEKDKMQKFIKELEQKYQLKQDAPAELMNLKFSASSKNLKQNLENLFGQLNRMEFITSNEMYDQALGLFHVEIRKSGRGHLFFVTEENGNPFLHPLKMGDFKEKQRFYQSPRLNEKSRSNDFDKPGSSDIEKGNRSLKSLVVRELMLQITKQQSEHRVKKFNQKKKEKSRKGKRF